MLDLHRRLSNLTEPLLWRLYFENPSFQRNTDVLHLHRKIDIPTERPNSPLPNKQVNSSGARHSLFFLDFSVLSDAVIWSFDLSSQDEGAVAGPGDGDFVWFLDARDFHLDEIFFDSVAEVEVRLVGVVFWSRMAAGEVLDERLVLMVAFVWVINQRWCVFIVL